MQSVCLHARQTTSQTVAGSRQMTLHGSIFWCGQDAGCLHETMQPAHGSRSCFSGPLSLPAGAAVQLCSSPHAQNDFSTSEQAAAVFRMLICGSTVCIQLTMW